MIKRIHPKDVHSTLAKHMLVDGFDFVLDLQKSQGSRIVDAISGKSYLDFFSFFASAPLGMNHPRLQTDEFRNGLLEVAVNKPSNSDVYTTYLAEFVEKFSETGIPDYLPHLFIVSGGALAVANALKAAFDWKVRKLYPQGLSTPVEEDAVADKLKVIYFKDAFHGRSGYTLSMTNTFYRDKVRHFPKFDWIKADNPKLHFPATDDVQTEVQQREQAVLTFIREQISAKPEEIAAIMIEPIQAEGGDNHFRPEFLRGLREICDESDVMLIFDEIQTGVGLTGSFWYHEQIDVRPDILAFGKKMQVCGILASARIDEVPDNVFAQSSRINSTWGANLTDAYRATWILDIIQEEDLIGNVRTQGELIVGEFRKLATDFPVVSNPRGAGLMCAFDLESEEQRDALWDKAYQNRLLLLKCGEKSIRVRPALNVTSEAVDEAMGLVRQSLQDIA